MQPCHQKLVYGFLSRSLIMKVFLSLSIFIVNLSICQFLLTNYCQFVNLSIICQFVNLSIFIIVNFYCQFVNLSIVNLSICQFLLSICQFVNLSIFLSLSIFIVNLSICQFLLTNYCQFVNLSIICQFVNLSIFIDKLLSIFYWQSKIQVSNSQRQLR